MSGITERIAPQSNLTGQGGRSLEGIDPAQGTILQLGVPTQQGGLCVRLTLGVVASFLRVDAVSSVHHCTTVRPDWG